MKILQTKIIEKNRTVRLAEIPFGGKDGLTWNHLHGEREEICETLLQERAAERVEILQARLRTIDDALDRLMSGTTALRNDEYETADTNDLLVQSLEPFDTILLRTQNSAYRILLLDPTTGRALVEGGDYLIEPKEALLRGSAAPRSELKSGSISVGSRLELWVNERALLTSPIKSVQVKHNSAESVQDISVALH